MPARPDQDGDQQLRLLADAWDKVARHWRDGRARQFDADHVTPLLRESRGYLEALRRLLDLLEAAERDTGELGGIVRGEGPGLDQDHPVARVVAHHGLDTVGAFGGFLQEFHALGAELVVGLAAIIDVQAKPAHDVVAGAAQVRQQLKGDRRRCHN